MTTFDVQENDETIGSLMRIPSVGYVFSYDESYIKNGGHELCVTMPLDQVCYFYEELPPYFTNVLSEGWLNAVQNEHVNRCFLSEDVKNLGVVAHFGQSCFGALTFRKRIEDAVKRKDEGPRLEADDDFAVLAEAVGCGEHAMIPGAYPKVLAVASETEPDAFRIARVGEDSTHIAKLFHKEARLMGVLGNEYVATQIVSHLLPDDEVCELFFAKLEGAEDKALMIKRFDRGPAGERLPFYEFNQLLGKANIEKYDGSYSEMAIIFMNMPVRTVKTASNAHWVMCGNYSAACWWIC